MKMENSFEQDQVLLAACNFSEYENLSAEELRQEEAELNAEIRNEEIWHLGATDLDSVKIHAENLHILKERLLYVKELLDEEAD